MFLEFSNKALVLFKLRRSAIIFITQTIKYVKCKLCKVMQVYTEYNLI